MASEFTAVNPKRVGNADGSPIQRTDATKAATDAKQWKRGEFGHIASGAGTVTPNTTTTGAKVTRYQMSEDQDTNTSSSEVPVHVLRDGDLFEMYVTNNGTDAAIGIANVGVRYGVYTKSNVVYLDVNDDGGQFEVVDLAADYEPERNLTADTPGKCIVEYRQEVSDTDT